ncbi:plasmid partitioning protein RepB [Roseivivax marinus]|nr:plasmid partitioning protein RepB [Roseivivax marinus]
MKHRTTLMANLKSLEEKRAAAETGKPEPEERASPAPSTAQNRMSGAVGAVASTMARLEERSVREIPAHEVAASRFSDRLDIEDSLDELIASIRENGQQIPILVRHLESPRDGALYEVVYGRRRLAAAKALDRPVRAHVTRFDEREAVIAQGLENAARLETSFIERARFARQLEIAGYDGPTIRQTLNIDAPMLSRMLSVIRVVPETVIVAIGPAHGAGRRTWETLRKTLEAHPLPEDDILAAMPAEADSATRLKGLVEAVTARARAPQAPRRPKAADTPDQTIGSGRLRLKRTPSRVVLNGSDAEARAFLDHLETSLPELFDAWKARNGSDK